MAEELKDDETRLPFGFITLEEAKRRHEEARASFNRFQARRKVIEGLSEGRSFNEIIEEIGGIDEAERQLGPQAIKTLRRRLDAEANE